MDGYYTVGDLASYFGVRQRAVDYAIRSRGVKECGRVGVVRLFDESARAAVGEALVSVARTGMGRPEEGV